jgi:hypothetical protein
VLLLLSLLLLLAPLVVHAQVQQLRPCAVPDCCLLQVQAWLQVLAYRQQHQQSQAQLREQQGPSQAVAAYQAPQPSCCEVLLQPQLTPLHLLLLLLLLHLPRCWAPRVALHCASNQRSAVSLHLPAAVHGYCCCCHRQLVQLPPLVLPRPVLLAQLLARLPLLLVLLVLLALLLCVVRQACALLAASAPLGAASAHAAAPLLLPSPRACAAPPAPAAAGSALLPLPLTYPARQQQRP